MGSHAKAGKVTVTGVVQAMHYRQKWYYHLQTHGLRKGDEHRAYAPVENGTFYVNGIMANGPMA